MSRENRDDEAHQAEAETGRERAQRAGEDPSSEGAPPDQLADELDCVDESVDEEHLAELPDGSGCVEVWEHLADSRGED